LVERFEWHYTPKHGSWLNLAESECSFLSMSRSTDVSRERSGRRHGSPHIALAACGKVGEARKSMIFPIEASPSSRGPPPQHARAARPAPGRWCTSRDTVASSPARWERGLHQTMGGHDAAKIHPPTYCIRQHVARRHVPRQRGRGHPATAAQSGAAE